MKTATGKTIDFDRYPGIGTLARWVRAGKKLRGHNAFVASTRPVYFTRLASGRYRLTAAGEALADNPGWWEV